jgi:hypothetical protein
LRGRGCGSPSVAFKYASKTTATVHGADEKCILKLKTQRCDSTAPENKKKTVSGTAHVITYTQTDMQIRSGFINFASDSYVFRSKLTPRSLEITGSYYTNAIRPILIKEFLHSFLVNALPTAFSHTPTPNSFMYR